MVKIPISQYNPAIHGRVHRSTLWRAKKRGYLCIGYHRGPLSVSYSRPYPNWFRDDLLRMAWSAWWRYAHREGLSATQATELGKDPVAYAILRTLILFQLGELKEDKKVIYASLQRGIYDFFSKEKTGASKWAGEYWLTVNDVITCSENKNMWIDTLMSLSDRDIEYLEEYLNNKRDSIPKRLVKKLRDAISRHNANPDRDVLDIWGSKCGEIGDVS